MTEQVAHGLTSAALGPALGSVLVIIAWLLSSVRDGVPVREQLSHAAQQLRPVAIGGAAAGGVALLGGQPWPVALAIGLSAALTAAGFRVPPAPKP